MKATLATFVLLGFAISPVVGHEKEVTRKPGLFFTPRPRTLLQEAALSIIKKMIQDDTFKKTVNPDLIPVDIKNTMAIAHMLNCMQKLNEFIEFTQLEQDNLITIVYNQFLVNKLLNTLNGYEKQLRTCLNAVQQSTILQSMQLITHKISYVNCIKDNLSLIVSDEQLSYLLLQALNDRDIAQAVFNNNSAVIQPMINSFIDLLVVKDKSYIVKKLLSYGEMRKIILSRLIDLYLIDEEFTLVNNLYKNEIIDTHFIDTLHDILLHFFQTELADCPPSDELGNFLVSRFITSMPFLTEDYKELLNNLLDHIDNPLFVFGDDHTAIPYEYWLFEYLHNDRDLLNNKIKEIIYFLEKGLTLNALDSPINAQDNYVIQRAKRNFEFLKQQEPAIIQKFVEAQKRYLASKK